MSNRTLQRWDEAVRDTFNRRSDLHPDDPALARVPITIEPEYRHYLDSALTDLAHPYTADTRHAPTMARLRSAAIEVLVAAYLNAIAGESDLTEDAGDVDDETLRSSLANDTVNIAPGLLTRLSPVSKDRLETIECRLPADLLDDLDDVLTTTLAERLDQPAREAWERDLTDLRSALVEAGLLTWLVRRAHHIDPPYASTRRPECIATRLHASAPHDQRRTRG